MALGTCPILPPAQSRKALRRMRETESGRWSEGGRTECGGWLGLNNEAGPIRCGRTASVQDDDAGGLVTRSEDLKDPFFPTHPERGHER